MWCSGSLTFFKLYQNAVHRFDLPCPPTELSIAGEVHGHTELVLPYIEDTILQLTRDNHDCASVSYKVPEIQLAIRVHRDISVALSSIFSVYSLDSIGMAAMTASQ